MKVRKVVRRLSLGALVGAMVLSMLPAHAGTTPVIPDASNDVVDIVRHTQNSFRPSTSPFPSPYTSYQHACSANAGDSGDVFSWNCSSFDLTSSQVVTDPLAQTITFTMHTAANIPPRGAALTSVPSPFNGLDYAWYFATSAQEAPQIIGINCTSSDITLNNGVEDGNGYIRDDFTIDGTAPNSHIGAEVRYTPNATCPDAGTGAVGADNESKGIQNGTNTRNVLIRENVYSPVHPHADGWQAFVEVGMTSAANGSKRLDGQGNLVCAGGAAACIDYDMSIGSYEGYSGVSTSNSMLDFDPKTQAKTSFSISGNTLTATIPWNPSTISSPDGDGVLDDQRSFPWPLAIPGAGTRFTQLTAEVSGLISGGADTGKVVNAVCPDDTDNIIPEAPEPLRTVGATVGTVNRTIGTTTNTVSDTISDDPDDNGTYIFGTGGHDQGDCIRGITGLLTFLDWTDNGAELRIYPRQPPYLPSASSPNCRYPLGEHPTAFAGVANVTADPVDAAPIDADTSPYDKPYNAMVWANGTSPQVNQAGPVLPNPGPVANPLAGTIGKNQSCNYTYWAPGIHYFDILADFTM